jgi:hypothetical protein
MPLFLTESRYWGAAEMEHQYIVGLTAPYFMQSLKNFLSYPQFVLLIHSYSRVIHKKLMIFAASRRTFVLGL